MKPALSIIVCSRVAQDAERLKRNLKGTAKAPSAIEIIIIDNSSNTLGICAAYNHGVSMATGDVLVFMHEDVWMMEREWDSVLLQKFRELPNIQMLGVAGSSLLLCDPWPLWYAANIPYTFGKVTHLICSKDEYFLAIYNERNGDQEVVALDGLWFAAKRSLFEHCRFDDARFKKFHFYDLDICMQARDKGKLYATADIRVLHKSEGSFDETWKEQSQIFMDKWKDKLPAKTLEEPPPAARIFQTGRLDLRGKVQIPDW